MSAMRDWRIERKGFDEIVAALRLKSEVAASVKHERVRGYCWKCGRASEDCRFVTPKRNGQVESWCFTCRLFFDWIGEER
jgi:hypothetical protein